MKYFIKSMNKMSKIKTVRELIKALTDFNPDAKIFIGDNINNHVTLSWGGADGCTKENCESVGFHLELEEDGEQPSVPENGPTPVLEHDFSLEQEERLFGETIVITDPCYLKKSSPLIKTSTIYGDWSCMVYPGRMGENKDPEEWDDKYFKFYNNYNFGNKTEEEKETLRNDWKWFKKRWKEEHTLGEFCADAGQVGVFIWNRLSDDDKKWVREHDWCAAVIENVSGYLGFKTVTQKDGNRSRHVVCIGDTNFFTVQSGL